MEFWMHQSQRLPTKQVVNSQCVWQSKQLITFCQEMQSVVTAAGAPSDIFPGTGCTLMHCAQDAHWCIAHSCNFDASWWHFSSAGFEASELALPVLSASCTCYPPLSLLRRAVHCTLGGRLKCNNNIYLMPTVSLNESTNTNSQFPIDLLIWQVECQLHILSWTHGAAVHVGGQRHQPR